MKRISSLSNIQDANSTASSEQIDVVGDNISNTPNYHNSTQKIQQKPFQGSFRSPIKLAREISNAITTPVNTQLTPYTQNQLTPTSNPTNTQRSRTTNSSNSLVFQLQQTPTGSNAF